jgi:hypothetical protein
VVVGPGLAGDRERERLAVEHAAVLEHPAAAGQVVEGVGVVEVEALQPERQEQRARDEDECSRRSVFGRLLAQGRIMPRARFLM